MENKKALAGREQRLTGIPNVLYVCKDTDRRPAKLRQPAQHTAAEAVSPCGRGLLAIVQTQPLQANSVVCDFGS